MRLTDLSPKWVGVIGEHHGLKGSAHTGIRFNCPHCGERLVVQFKPYIDPNHIQVMVPWAFPDAPNPNTGEASKVKHWERAGETFEDITLSPSIDASASGCWHGFITNGEVT